jgi:hypothetical protein
MYIYIHIYICCIRIYLHIYTLIQWFSVTEHGWTWWDLRSANTASPREWPTPGRWVTKKRAAIEWWGWESPNIGIHIYIYIYIYTYIYIYGGFHKWWYPNCWMVYFMENPIKMIKHGWFAGTPILGNHHIKKKNNHWVLISLHPYNQNVGMYIQVATFPSWVGDGTCVVEPQTSTEHIQSIWT